MSKKISSLLCVFIFFISCKKKITSKVLTKNTEVVLIFKNTPNKQMITPPTNIGFSTFFNKIGTYFNGYENVTINPKRGNKVDTIKILINSKSIEINIEDGKYDYHRFLLRKGDTMNFMFKNNILTTSLNNLPDNYLDYNQYIDKILNKKYSEKIKFLHPLPFVPFIDSTDNSSYKERFKKFRKKSGKLMLNDLKKESNILDSLRELEKIPNHLFNYRKTNMKLYRLIYEIMDNKMTNKKIDSLLSNSDSLLKTKLFREDLIKKLITKRYNIKTFKSKNKYYFDSRQAFDSINSSKLISIKLKDFLYYEYLKSIKSNFSLNDFNKYFKIFKSNIKDKKYLSHIEEKYITNFNQLKSQNENLFLIDLNENKKHFKHVIQQNKGKLIYVDFWASWCVPCLEEIPSSIKLRKELINKDIIFIYISIDKDKVRWKEASKKEKIDFSESYLAINYPNSNFFKKIDLKNIPRYLLYDKKGKLVHKNAPSPSSNQLKKLIENYLKN